MPVERFLKTVVAFILTGVALAFFLSLASYHPDDVSILNQRTVVGHEAPANLFGNVGASVSAVTFQLWGLNSFFLVYFFGIGVYYYRREETLTNTAIAFKWIGGALFMFFFPAWGSLLVPTFPWRGVPILTGGLIGDSLKKILLDNLNYWGTFFTTLFLTLLGVMFFFSWTPGQPVPNPFGLFGGLRRKAVLAFYRWKNRKKEARIAGRILKEAEEEAQPAAPRVKPAPEPEPARKSRALKKKEKASAAGETSPEDRQMDLFPTPDTSYMAPPTALLDPPERIPQQTSMELAKVIEKRFEEFQVKGTVEGMHPGPVVTTFEYRPSEGIKLTRIMALQDDLAMALKAESVRIDRIPGKGTVGIEVPNLRRERIALREILESEAYTLSPGALTLALGKDIHGSPFAANLATMPHLLIAGATGSGKSVALNVLLMSLLFKAGPEQVKLILIDPKKVEFSVYEDIPHLCTPIITQPKRAAQALLWALAELEKRSRLLKEMQVRDIESYNRAVRGRTDYQHLPFIVIFVDELADLMLQLRKEVEDSITRLAQMARAVGIHLVMATQRPSTDIITGLIKTNFPTRIAFHVADKVNSRVILDDNGAEKLLGNGDMLLLTSSSGRLKRLHGAFVSQPEISRVVKFLRQQARPDFIQEVVQQPIKSDAPGEAEVGEDDPVWIEAVRTVLSTRVASATFLQRKLRIGYAKAARLLDLMEQKGLIGPTQGAKPREILLSKDDAKALIRNLDATDSFIPPEET